MIQGLLQGTLDGADEDLAELGGRLQPRTVRKVSEFVDILQNNGAQVAIGLNGRVVALRTPTEVEQATSRLVSRNFEEETTTTDGTLIGMVPSRRFFEFAYRSPTNSYRGE